MTISDVKYKTNGEEVTTISGLGNVCMDWDIGHCFFPYLGLGIGYGRTHEEYIDLSSMPNIMVSPVSDTSMNIIAQGIGGISCPCCDYIDVSLEYRYIYKSQSGDNRSIGISVKGYF